MFLKGTVSQGVQGAGRGVRGQRVSMYEVRAEQTSVSVAVFTSSVTTSQGKGSGYRSKQEEKCVARDTEGCSKCKHRVEKPSGLNGD